MRERMGADEGVGGVTGVRGRVGGAKRGVGVSCEGRVIVRGRNLNGA